MIIVIFFILITQLNYIFHCYAFWGSTLKKVCEKGCIKVYLVSATKLQEHNQNVYEPNVNSDCQAQLWLIQFQ